MKKAMIQIKIGIWKNGCNKWGTKRKRGKREPKQFCGYPAFAVFNKSNCPGQLLNSGQIEKWDALK